MSHQSSVNTNTPSTRSQALEAKLHHLSKKIEVEQSRPFTKEELLKKMKRKRLHIKEKIEGIN
jgi:hypothetical protein